MTAQWFDLMRVVVTAFFAWTTVAGAASLDTGSESDAKARVQMLISQMTLAEKIGQLREDRSPYETLAESSRRRLLPRESRCHLVVLVLGEDRYMIGEFASRSSLDLPGGQQQLMEQVASLHKPTVLVLLNGRPLNICWANEHLPAILEACYPGCEGGNAIANLLLGIAVPGGKLPFTSPHDVGQIPMYYDHTLPQNPENVSAHCTRN